MPIDQISSTNTPAPKPLSKKDIADIKKAIQTNQAIQKGLIADRWEMLGNRVQAGKIANEKAKQGLFLGTLAGLACWIAPAVALYKGEPLLMPILRPTLASLTCAMTGLFIGANAGKIKSNEYLLDKSSQLINKNIRANQAQAQKAQDQD